MQLQIAVGAALLLLLVYGSDPVYDHQTKTYYPQHKGTYCRLSCTVTPFFSPDSSVWTYLSLIESATTSIDLLTPGFSSWSYCTSEEAACQGCPILAQKLEEFPVFSALLNARHQRNITIRILTNDYDLTTCPGKITPLDWLYLNGIEIRTYTSTTFMHSKVVIVDNGNRTSISSVNFSYTSFMLNREAGVVLDGACNAAMDFYESVFEGDWNVASEYKVQNKYTESEMDVITDPRMYPIPFVKPKFIPGAYVTNSYPISNVSISKVYTAPDYARSTLFEQLDKATSSFVLYTYELKDTGLCSKVIEMHSKGILVNMMVSTRVVSETASSNESCYTMLEDAGIRIRYSPCYYEYAHQKFWIVDNTTVHLSTGNWNPSDFPEGTSFPPYGHTGWQSVNRDMLVVMESYDVVFAFTEVFYQDWKRGSYDYYHCT